jgi:D-alanine--poly(phosphoribitol) ligase subunit 2
MSDDLTLQNQIAHLFLKEMNLEVPSPDTDLFETGILDSLAFVDLALHLEQKFGVKMAIESMELDHFRSIARIAQFVGNQDHNGHPETE